MIHNKYNRGGLFEWSVSADEKNSTINILGLQQGGFVMPRDYYLNKTDDDEMIVAYLEYMTKVGVLLGANEETTMAQMKEVLKLEREIAKVNHSFQMLTLLFQHWFLLDPSAAWTAQRWSKELSQDDTEKFDQFKSILGLGSIFSWSIQANRPRDKWSRTDCRLLTGILWQSDQFDSRVHE